MALIYFIRVINKTADAIQQVDRTCDNKDQVNKNPCWQEGEKEQNDIFNQKNYGVR